jgi:hypothetical protein
VRSTSYDALAEIDQLLEDYFRLLDEPVSLRARLVTAQKSPLWSGQTDVQARDRIQKDLDTLAQVLSRGVTRDKKKRVTSDLRPYFKTHAILDLDKRFVDGMVRGGMHWGASYGDLMHFDLRRTGVGKYIEKARNAYLGKARTQMKRHLKAKEYGYHELED